MLRMLARSLAVLCAIAFVFLTVGVIFFRAAGTRFLQSPIYKHALAREQFYERFPSLVAGGAVHSAELRSRVTGRVPGASELLAQLTPADWQRLLGAIAPAPYLRAQGESGLDQLAESFHSDVSTLSVEISLVELKQNLVGPQAEEAFLAVLQTKPPATLQQIEETGGLPRGRRPPDELMPQVRQQFRSAVRSLVSRLPDTIDPFTRAAAFGGVGRAMTAMAGARETLLRIERWAQWSPAVPVLLLLLIALFAVRSLRGWLIWWGLPCFLAGSAAALLALPVVPVTQWVFSVFVVPHFPPETPAELIQATFGLMTAGVQEVMTAALISASVLAGGGLLCMFVALFSRRRPTPAIAPMPDL